MDLGGYEDDPDEEGDDDDDSDDDASEDTAHIIKALQASSTGPPATVTVPPVLPTPKESTLR